MRPDGLSDIANVLSHTGKAADFVADYLNDRLQYHAEAAKAASLPAQAAEVVSKLEDLKSAFDATREWSVEVEERLTVVVFGLSNGCSIELLDERDEPHVRSSDWELLLRSGAPSHLPLLERLVVPEYPVNTYLGTKWEFQRWGSKAPLSRGSGQSPPRPCSSPRPCMARWRTAPPPPSAAPLENHSLRAGEAAHPPSSSHARFGRAFEPQRRQPRTCHVRVPVASGARGRVPRC